MQIMYNSRETSGCSSSACLGLPGVDVCLQAVAFSASALGEILWHLKEKLNDTRLFQLEKTDVAMPRRMRCVHQACWLHRPLNLHFAPNWDRRVILRLFLLTCAVMQSRSPAVVMGYLMHARQMRLADSYKHVQERRPTAKLSDGANPCNFPCPAGTCHPAGACSILKIWLQVLKSSIM